MFPLLNIDVDHWRLLSIYMAPYLFLFVYDKEVSFQFCFLRKVLVNTSNKLGQSTVYIIYLLANIYRKPDIWDFNQILQGSHRNGRLFNIFLVIILLSEGKENYQWSDLPQMENLTSYQKNFFFSVLPCFHLEKISD